MSFRKQELRGGFNQRGGGGRAAVGRGPADLAHPDLLVAVAVVGHRLVDLAIAEERVLPDAVPERAVAVVAVRRRDEAGRVSVDRRDVEDRVVRHFSDVFK